MKKTYIAIASLLLCANLMAQTPAHRTAQTVTADVLAQMPAETQQKYNQLINDLKGTGEEGVLALVKMINAPGKGSNAQVDYALSGLTHYVMAKGEESARETIAKAYGKALGQVSERETKAFIIRQLQICGGDESVALLLEYANDQELSGPAVRALASIGTKEAAQGLVGALKNRMGSPETKLHIVRALADFEEAEGAEPVLLGLREGADEKMQKEINYALSQLGSSASLKVLAEAAAKANYVMENTGANEAYIMLIKRLAAKGDTKTAQKAAADLMKKATKANQVHSREAALEILLSVQPATAQKQILATLKDPCKAYRNAALNFASDYADATLYVELLKAMDKAKDEVKVDVLNWIGRESKCPNKKDILKKLEIRFDLSAEQLMVNQLKNANFDVKQATVWALVRIGNESVIPVLADLLTQEDKQVVLLGQDALAAFRGDIDQAVAKVIPTAKSDAGKIAGLELLALRKADANLNTVLEQTKSGSNEVKKAAFDALKDVVAEKDFTLLCGMLEVAEPQTVDQLQAAVISTLRRLTPAQQEEKVSRRMIQAGDSKKYLYYKVLASTGEPKALQTIVAGFNQSSGVAKDQALGALVAWKGLDAAEELFTICKQPLSASAFDQALNRYVELVASPTLTGENRLIFLRKAMEIAKTDEQKVKILRTISQAGTFLSMMYASEFLNGSPAVRSAAVYAIWNIARNHPEYTGDNVKGLLKKILPMFDGEDARYDHDALVQHIEKMPDETGFVQAFNGTDLTGWKGMVGKDGDGNPYKRYKMTPAKLAKEQEAADERMRKDWFVKDGCIVFEGSGYDNLCTAKAYGDFEMYVDWMLDPNGKEPDAGIYLRATPQVQIWDTSRVNVGAQVGSGGLYNNAKNERNPLKVADNKLGEWNSFYIKMVGDRVTVKLNGELVVDNVIMENYWDRSQPILPIEQIELQAHGSRCSFRNIYIKELKRVEPFQLSDEEKKEGFKVLFDGTNMHEWTGNTVDYTLEDGCISMNPSKSFGGNLYTKDEYANFVYRFDFQLTPGANNGVGIRTPMEGDAAYVGMEIQVLDCEHPIYKNITKLQHHGSVYGIIPAKDDHPKAFKPAGEWNTEEIYADGDYIRVTVNGVVITEGNIREAVKNGTPDGHEHPGLFNKKGHIGFLGHGSPVKFRNIRIKELK
ncbi:MAG: DUF1080 domain-containing protein [Parabacteroides sp.]|nr:DUF1080 domain-containing protein [Parabacteroides sp.]